MMTAIDLLVTSGNGPVECRIADVARGKDPGGGAAIRVRRRDRLWPAAGPARRQVCASHARPMPTGPGVGSI